MSMHAAGEQVTADWVLSQIQWPPMSPKTLGNLEERESDIGILELYLWLRYVLFLFIIFIYTECQHSKLLRIIWGKFRSIPMLLKMFPCNQFSVIFIIKFTYLMSYSLSYLMFSTIFSQFLEAGTVISYH